LGELEEVVGGADDCPFGADVVEAAVNVASVFSPFTAAKASPEPVEGALNAGLWFRRIRFVNISPQPTAIMATVRQKLPLSRRPKLPSPL
jgi:hypothetical protein